MKLTDLENVLESLRTLKVGSSSKYDQGKTKTARNINSHFLQYEKG